MADSKQKNKEESKYSREELVENSQAIFNEKPEVVDGALHDKKGNSFSLTEVKEAITAFKKRKVK